MGILKIFIDYRQFQIFALGIFSAVPLVIIYSTLSAWLTDEGVDIAIITTFAFSRIFYSLKVFWAPLIDRLRLPLLSKIGHRKSWMVFCLSIVALVLYLMSILKSVDFMRELYILTGILGLASATYDIVYDAYRIEILESNLQSLGAANAVFGYRIGTLIAGAGAFYYADIYSWRSTFALLSMLYVVGILYILTLREKGNTEDTLRGVSLRSWKVIILDPFADFFKRDNALLITAAIIFFKLGDAMLGVVATPFYLKLGFSKTEISSVVKIFGLIATILGTYIGAYIVYRVGHFKGLIITGIAQSVTNASFVWLNHVGHDLEAFIVTIATENVASGMGSAALVGYLSTLCNRKFSAAQYALLSSTSGLFSHSIVAYGGLLVKILDWDLYFLMTIAAALPGILILIKLNNKQPSR